MYFPDEEVSFIGEDIAESYDSWRMFFDGAANFKGVGTGAVVVSETGQRYPVCAKLRFPCTNNMAEYEACILGLKMAIGMNVQELLVIEDSDLLIHQVREEWATKNSKILLRTDGKHWFHDIKEYLEKGEYPELANPTQKCTLRRLSNNLFHSGGILYRRTPDMGLLRCVDAKEASRLLEEIHVVTCGPHMNCFVLAKKILRAGYFWITMETDCIQCVRKCLRY
ncbi:uncharacterized protein [Nicotiana sylvestris]|uniref:uncharacterized protein n=1 Tax=Nicotiana sylvestris TaxID=4096 RepID=UPI00388CBB88